MNFIMKVKKQFFPEKHKKRVYTVFNSPCCSIKFERKFTKITHVITIIVPCS